MLNMNVCLVKLMKSVPLILVQLHILVSLNQLTFEVCINIVKLLLRSILLLFSAFAILLLALVFAQRI